jgi:hypothetical protein
MAYVPFGTVFPNFNRAETAAPRDRKAWLVLRSVASGRLHAIERHQVARIFTASDRPRRASYNGYVTPRL